MHRAFVRPQPAQLRFVCQAPPIAGETRHDDLPDRRPRRAVHSGLDGFRHHLVAAAQREGQPRAHALPVGQFEHGHRMRIGRVGMHCIGTRGLGQLVATVDGPQPGNTQAPPCFLPLALVEGPDWRRASMSTVDTTLATRIAGWQYQARTYEMRSRALFERLPRPVPYPSSMAGSWIWPFSSRVSYGPDDAQAARLQADPQPGPVRQHPTRRAVVGRCGLSARAGRSAAARSARPSASSPARGWSSSARGSGAYVQVPDLARAGRSGTKRGRRARRVCAVMRAAARMTTVQLGQLQRLCDEMAAVIRAARALPG